MLTFFAIVFLTVFVGILFGAAIVEVQKKYHARTHASTVWQNPAKRNRSRPRG